MAALAIACLSSPSLFESPNENIPTQSAKCFLAKASEVSSSLSSKTLNAKHDVASLSIEDENAAMDRFMANLQGETKEHFEGLLKQYLETHTLLEKKQEDEREYADEIASLNVALEEEHEVRVSLEEKLDSIEESNNKIISKLTKNAIMLLLSINWLKRKGRIWCWSC